MSAKYLRELHPKKILIITSSGGGGLIQTANAKEQQARSKDPEVRIVRRDLLQDWVWKPMGQYFINFWNKAQKKGNVSAQTFCVAGQFLVDFFLHPVFFVYALITLFKYDIDHVIDTQPLGTSAILNALRIYNRKQGKTVRLEKVVVDLPTKKATHFFRSIKKLSPANRKLIFLTTIAPLLEEGETEEQFWQSTCGLSLADIHLEEPYIRHAFTAFKGKERTSEVVKIQIVCKNEEELDLMQTAFERGCIRATVQGREVEFAIDPSDRMFTILLGSQPAREATLNYVKKLTSVVEQFPGIKTHLFVFCADHEQGADSLLRKVADFAARLKHYPKHLSIIPFSFQTEKVIAPLFYRSDLTCTRSGGQTAMELMCVSTGEICIHSEAVNGQDVLQGIPGWEAASAVYLQQLKKARIVTPETVISVARQLYQTNIRAVSSGRRLKSTA